MSLKQNRYQGMLFCTLNLIQFNTPKITTFLAKSLRKIHELKVSEYPYKLKILKQPFPDSRCCYSNIMKGKWAFWTKLLFVNEI